MGLGDLGAIAGTLLVLSCIGFFLYSRYMKH